jgi:hypothetical protein
MSIIENLIDWMYRHQFHEQQVLRLQALAEMQLEYEALGFPIQNDDLPLDPVTETLVVIGSGGKMIIVEGEFNGQLIGSVYDGGMVFNVLVPEEKVVSLECYNL